MKKVYIISSEYKRLGSDEDDNRVSASVDRIFRTLEVAREYVKNKAEAQGFLDYKITECELGYQIRRYEITDETKEFEFKGKKYVLNRIRSTQDFTCQGKEVHIGDLGGFVEKKNAHLILENDPYIGENSWIFNNACVFENASVHDDAYVCNEAMVYGAASVRDHAIVEGYAEIEDFAEITGNAIVADYAIVKDSAQVYGDAKIGVDATIYDHAKIGDQASVYGMAKVHGNAKIGSNAFVHEQAEIYGDAEVSQNTEVYGTAKVYDKAKIANYNDNKIIKIEGQTQVHGESELYYDALTDLASLGKIPCKKMEDDKDLSFVLTDKDCTEKGIEDIIPLAVKDRILAEAKELAAKKQAETRGPKIKENHKKNNKNITIDD